MIKIYIDADACPVKDESLRVAERHELEIFYVTNNWLRPFSYTKAQIVPVASGPDVADDWIAEHIREGDIAVTSDIPLADRCLKRGAEVLSPFGKPFTGNNIGAKLAMRDLNAHLRETGEISGSNPAFTGKDRSRFLQALEQMAQTAKRRAG